ncbi:MAG TPA: HAMP domain-containing sensor histidine kinase [Bacteriovoracaceae bacterium]|nr:HAMP domain-containing sensor histidine kinase [Bacteriovoracaceae bacterium]
MENQALIWTQVISDLLIGLAFLSISISLFLLVKKTKIRFHAVIISFCIFIGTSGLTHFLEVWNFWHTDYLISTWLKVVTATASVVTGIWLIRLHDPILEVSLVAKLAEERRRDLESLTRNLEERVEARTEELSHAVAARDQFLSVASHELKTPLTSMKLQTQMRSKRMMEGTAQGPEGIAKYYKNMNDQIVRLNHLVEDMLDISHIQRGEFRLNVEEYDISLLISEVIEHMPGIKIQFEASSPVMLTIDKNRIEQVIDHLLTNALKYAPGTLIKINLSVEDNKVQVAISDGGPGIDPALKDRIFEKFERAISHNEVSGLGLGLFISRTIINAHGGKIWLDSGPGIGSTFIFELPINT